MIDYHKYVGYCRSDEKREKPVGGAGGRWDEEKPVENKPVENKPVESGGTIQPIRPSLLLMEQLVGLRPRLLFVWFIFVRFIFAFPSTIPCTESQTDQNFPCGHKLFSNVFMVS